MLPREKVDAITSRIAALGRIRTPDSLVVTGMPFAVAASSNGARAPVETLFTLGRQSDLDKFLKQIEAQRPSMLIFDGPETPAWGAQAVSRIVARLEAGIGPTYRLIESGPQWRVWKSL
jgi:hypothetical protein